MSDELCLCGAPARNGECSVPGCVASVKPAAPDATVIRSLKQLNRLLAPEAKQWTLVRSRAGYYYFVHPEHAPSAGVYVFSCKDTTLGYWRNALNEHLERE